MACLLRGLDADETLAMTRAMIASGETVTFPGLTVPTVDKHSTGGVADGVTLVFAPIAASLGLAVAKLSGRGLGHTGGTLDKLESIPGLRTDLSPAEMEEQVARVGCAVAAQSPTLVPADGALYALRDATATVPSIPLIAASVMSKKLAVATDLILLDVKAGSGAFMKTPEDAVDLANACLALGARRGTPGARRRHRHVPAARRRDRQRARRRRGGGAPSRGAPRPPARTRRRVRRHGARGGRWGSGSATPRHAPSARSIRGEALERFRPHGRGAGRRSARRGRPVGGAARAPPWCSPCSADRAGTLATVDAEAIGQASVALGAGRMRKGDPIDPSVGIVMRAKIGSARRTRCVDRRGPRRGPGRGRPTRPPRSWRR